MGHFNKKLQIARCELLTLGTAWCLFPPSIHISTLICTGLGISCYHIAQTATAPTAVLDALAVVFFRTDLLVAFRKRSLNIWGKRRWRFIVIMFSGQLYHIVNYWNSRCRSHEERAEQTALRGNQFSCFLKCAVKFLGEFHLARRNLKYHTWQIFSSRPRKAKNSTAHVMKQLS